MPKEENYMELLEPILRKVQSVEICVFDQFNFFILCLLPGIQSPCWFFRFLRTMKKIECCPRISYIKLIQQKNLVKQNKLLGRPCGPCILPRPTMQEMLQTLQWFKVYKPWISSMKGWQSGIKREAHWEEAGVKGSWIHHEHRERDWWQMFFLKKNQTKHGCIQNAQTVPTAYWSLVFPEGIRPLVAAARCTTPSPNWYVFL